MTQTKIPFLDLKRQYRKIKDDILAALEQVCEQTAFTDGPFVKEFEAKFAQYCEAKHAVCVSNGTAALLLALEALDIGPGDEVIIPANTFIATAFAVSKCGAIPIFVDCLPQTWQIDPEACRSAITEKTKAIIGVHLYGQPCELTQLRQLCDAHEIALIEDAAQAHGALYSGKKVGQFGDLAAFSFYPGKNLGAYGEGGAVLTNNAKLDEKLRMLRNHGSSKKYYHEYIGFNYRMSGFQGAVLNIKLDHLDRWTARRRSIAAAYQNGIKNDKVNLQFQPETVNSVYHLFVVTCDDRDALTEHLNADQIFPALHYPLACHMQGAYRSLGYAAGDFPNSEYLAAHCLSLPMFPELTDEEVQRVIDSVNAY